MTTETRAKNKKVNEVEQKKKDYEAMGEKEFLQLLLKMIDKSEKWKEDMKNKVKELHGKLVKSDAKIKKLEKKVNKNDDDNKK